MTIWRRKHGHGGSQARPARARRSGAALIVALICLLLATMLSASLVSGALRQREQVLSDEQQVQAAWLAEAGLERARNRLQGDPEFRGETWRPRVSDDVQPLGVVEVVVERASEEGGLVIHVTADVPEDPVERTRVSRRIEL